MENLVSRVLRACLLLAVIGLAGCASPYASTTLIGGYSDEKVSESRWRVKYSGNGYTDEEKVVKYWLNRCAELTVKNGYSYFSLVPGSSKAQLEGEDFTPTERARAQGDNGGMLKVRSAPTYIWVPSYGGGTVRTWSKVGVIQMYHTRAGAFTPEQAYALHAQTVLEMLKKYVATDGKEPGPSRKEVIDAAMFLSPIPAGSAGPRP